MQDARRIIGAPIGWAFGAAFGIVVAYVDLHNDEVQMSALLVLVFAALLGFLHPRHAWQWVLIIGLSVPAGHVVAALIGYNPPYLTTWPSTILLPLAFATAASYAGAGVRATLADHP